MPIRLRKFISLVLSCLLIFSLFLLTTCGGSEDPVGPTNTTPIVDNPILDFGFTVGFGTQTVPLGNVFDDDDGDVLTYSATSSNENVATASVSGTTLTLTEQGIGNANITVTADDGNEGTATDTFSISISEFTNSDPTVTNAISDMTSEQGFGASEVSLSNIFTDANNDALTFSAESSVSSVVTVAVTESTLTITEVGTGVSTITVTASDGNGGSAIDDFTFTVTEASGTCSGDNSVNTTLNQCPNTAAQAGLTSSYSESVTNDTRTITTNGVPNHSFGSPTDKIMANQVTWTMDATPVKATQTTPVLGVTRIDFQFGVAINGVKLDPEANFPFENTATGEQNYGWMLEATNNTTTTTLDCNQAHLQADGTYHYHGDFYMYAAEMGINGTQMVQIGWAADGYPVYYKYAYSLATDANSAIEEMKSSYELRTGDREGDGVSEPCGAYNGKYEQDYKYTEGLGDLDECNGRTGVTPEFPNGTYYYLITSDFPLIPRCFSGTPDMSFRIGGGMGG